MDKLSEGLICTTIDSNFSRIVKDLLNVSVLGLGAYRRTNTDNFTFLVFNNYDLVEVNFSLTDPQFTLIEFYELENFYSSLERQRKFEAYTMHEILFHLAHKNPIITGQSLVAFAAYDLLKKPVKFIPFPDNDKFVLTHTIERKELYNPDDDVSLFMNEYLQFRHLLVQNEKINLFGLESRLKELTLLLYNMFSNGTCNFETIVYACISIQEALQSLGSTERLLIPNLALPCIKVFSLRKLTSIDFINKPIEILKLEAEKASKFTEQLDLYSLLKSINDVLEYFHTSTIAISPNIACCTVSTFPHSKLYQIIDNTELLSVDEMKRLLIELNRLTKSSVKWGSPIDPRIGKAMNCLVNALSRYADTE